MNDSSRSEHREGGLIACHECDFLHSIQPVPAGGKALCTRCGAFLYKNIPNSLERALALNLSALMLFIMANIFPFISLKTSGRVEETVFISSILTFYRMGMGDVGVLVFLTSFLFPFLTIAGMLYVLLPLKYGYRLWRMASVYRMVKAITPWSLLGVFMLGLLLSIIKLRDLATVIPGISLFSFAALLVVSSAANANLDTSVIWPHMRFDSTGNGSGSTTRQVAAAKWSYRSGEQKKLCSKNTMLQDCNTAAEWDLISCHTCNMLVPRVSLDDKGNGDCPRCESPLHSRKVNSLTRTWALVFAAALLLIPANVFPVMTVIRFGKGDPNTILSGVVHLIEEGMWPLAMIVFFASLVVPILKLIVLTFLMITVKKKSSWRPRDRTILFRVTEVVGAWSMVDIYLLAMLIALVKFGFLATILPGIGATFFGAVVVTTMFAAHTFDPRLIWDNTGRNDILPDAEHRGI